MESKVRGEEERQKVERLVEKLKVHNNNNNRSSTPAHISFVPNSIVVSSRKLAAAFWEFHQYHYKDEEDCSYSYLSSASAKMHRGPNGFAGASSRRQRHGKAVAVKENGLDLSQFLRDPSPDHQVFL